jgi:Arc/MetJ-type ribon-helix-helix transcriptional regulator
MKVSVSLPGEDVEFLDAYAKEQRLESRSAALKRAVQLLRTAELGGTYEAAWAEWSAQADGTLWESTTGGGLKSRCAAAISTVAAERVGDRLGVVPHVVMLEIDEALRLHLGL